MDVEAELTWLSIAGICDTPEVSFDASTVAYVVTADASAHLSEGEIATLKAGSAVHRGEWVSGNVGGSIACWVVVSIAKQFLAGSRLWLGRWAGVELFSVIVCRLSDASIAEITWLVVWVEDIASLAGSVEAVVRCGGLPLVRAEASLGVPHILVVLTFSSSVKSSALSFVKAYIRGCGSCVAGIEMSSEEGVLLGDGEGGSECSRDCFVHLLF